MADTGVGDKLANKFDGPYPVCRYRLDEAVSCGE